MPSVRSCHPSNLGSLEDEKQWQFHLTHTAIPWLGLLSSLFCGRWEAESLALDFKDKGAGFEPWLSDFNPSSQTTQRTEVQLHCGTFPALCIVTARLHEDGMWKAGWRGGLVNEQKGRGASKGNWTHGTQDTCFWHQHSGYSSPLLWAEMSEGPQVKQLIGRWWSWPPLSWMKVLNVQDLPFLLVSLQSSRSLSLFLTFSFILITMLC